MAEDSDGEGFCADPFEDDSDGGDSWNYHCCYDDDDEGEWSCGAPCDEDEDDSNGEEICRDPCDNVLVVDDDEEGEVEDALCHDDDEGGSDGSLSDEDAEGEQLSDDDECEGKGGEFGDDRCDHEDEDEDEPDGESEDFCEDPSNHDEDVGPVVLSGGGGGGGFRLGELFVSRFLFSDHSDSEVEEAGGFNRGGEELTPSGFDQTRSPGAFRMAVGVEHSDSDTDSTDSEYEDGYEFLKRPASRQAVEGLPEMMLSEEEATCGCAVCKDVFASGQRVVFLPCKHYFHGDCILPWLAMRSTCPVCRYQLPTDDTRSGQGQAHQLRVLSPVDRQGASQQSGGGATTGSD